MLSNFCRDTGARGQSGWGSEQEVRSPRPSPGLPAVHETHARISTWACETQTAGFPQAGPDSSRFWQVLGGTVAHHFMSRRREQWKAVTLKKKKKKRRERESDVVLLI